MGEHFFPHLEEDAHINLVVKPNIYKKIYYIFDNKLTRETAFHVMHLLSHLRDAAFDCVHSYPNYSFPIHVNPEIAKIFFPIHCCCLELYSESLMPDTSPPPPTGTTTVPRFGSCSSSSRAIVPWPAMTSGSL